MENKKKTLKPGDNIVWFPKTGAIIMLGKVINTMHFSKDDDGRKKDVVNSVQEFKEFCDFTAGSFGLCAGRVNTGNDVVAVCPIVR